MPAEVKIVPLPVEDVNSFGKLYGLIDGLLNTSGLSCAECLGVLEYVKAKMIKDMIEREV